MQIQPFTVRQEMINHLILESVTKVSYNLPVKEEQMFGFANSYIVFDYGGCKIIEPNGRCVESPKIYLKTARPNYFKYSKNENTSYIIFRLKPTSFYTITGLSADENLYKYVLLDDYVHPKILSNLYEKCDELDTAKDIAEVFINTLQSNLVEWQKITPIDAILNDIMNCGGMLFVEDILEKHSLSMSTLNRYFKKYVGMTVALYIRLVKFNTLTAGLYSDGTKLQDIVAQYNFYDQTHFTKDFKKFSGITPKQYKGPNFELLRKALSYTI